MKLINRDGEVTTENFTIVSIGLLNIYFTLMFNLTKEKEPKIEKRAVIKIIGINLTLFLLLYGLVYINKAVFRPTFNDTQFAQILTGSFPTFIAAFLISLCAVNPVLIRKPRFGRLIVYLASLLIMVVLILDELESIGASMQYDIYDIAGAVLGSFLALLTYEYLHYIQSEKKIETKSSNR